MGIQDNTSQLWVWVSKCLMYSNGIDIDSRLHSSCSDNQQAVGYLCQIFSFCIQDAQKVKQEHKKSDNASYPYTDLLFKAHAHKKIILLWIITTPPCMSEDY